MENKEDVMNEKSWQEQKENSECSSIYSNRSSYNQDLFSSFLDKEAMIFSALDSELEVPSIIDGFNFHERKVMFACFHTNLIKSINVYKLASMVGEKSPYHQGHDSIVQAIIGLAQNYLGSNNLNLLLPEGQFGTRIDNGKDAAAPNVINTKMTSLAKVIYNKNDEHFLEKYQNENMFIEPKWYIPVVPMVLINGIKKGPHEVLSETPKFNIRDIIDNIKLLLEGKTKADLKPINPWFRNFKGEIEKIDSQAYVTKGNVNICGPGTVEISELPVGISNTSYKVTLENMINNDRDELGRSNHPNNKTQHLQKIVNYKDYSTDTDVKFVVVMTVFQLKEAKKVGLHVYLNLQSTINMSVTLLNKSGIKQHYHDVLDVIYEFYQLRLECYSKRKSCLLEMKKAEALKYRNKARFLQELNDGTIKIKNQKQLRDELKSRMYDPDPVKLRNEKISERHTQSEGTMPLNEYSYIMNMKIGDTRDEMLAKENKKYGEISSLEQMSISQMWLEDLNDLSLQLYQYEDEYCT